MKRKNGKIFIELKFIEGIFFRSETNQVGITFTNQLNLFHFENCSLKMCHSKKKNKFSFFGFTSIPIFNARAVCIFLEFSDSNAFVQRLSQKPYTQNIEREHTVRIEKWCENDFLCFVRSANYSHQCIFGCENLLWLHLTGMNRYEPTTISKRCDKRLATQNWHWWILRISFSAYL